MAYANTPVVQDNTLWLTDEPPVQVGSRAWFVWLSTAHSFSYKAPTSTYRLTVRKEKRRNCHYWYAYLKVDRKLHNAYLGRSTALTAQRLEDVALRLQRRIGSPHNPARTEVL